MEKGRLVATAVFPGQGSQHRGMVEEALLDNPSSREVLRMASRIAGVDLVGLCNEGPEEEMTRTDLCQISVAAVSLAWWALLREAGLEAVAVAGHSLGEWCAACACGSLGLEEALGLVWRRGRAMLQASRRNPGTMLALLGITREEAERVLEVMDADGRPVLANHNASRQVVLSGGREALERAAGAAAARGARCVWLKVGGPFHSPAMAEAQREMERMLDGAAPEAPRIPLYTGLTGRPVSGGDEVASCLAEGMTAAVRWHDLQGELAGMAGGVQVEVGPGTVLGRMASRDHPGTRFLSSREALDILGGA